MNPVTMDPIQIVKMKYLMTEAFVFFDFLFINTDKISCTPHPGQNHEQYARPKKRDNNNIKAKAIKLAFIIPLKDAATIITGEKSK
jgi:hypothetical protein